MKTLPGIRYILAAIIATFGSIALLAHMEGAMAFFLIPQLLIINRSEFIKPMPHKELLITLNSIIVLAIIAFTLIIYTSPTTKEAAARIISHPALVLPWWLFWMYVIYRGWQRQINATETKV
jgi:hypothetical protein